MIRKHFQKSTEGHEKYFSWRGGDVSRIEGLSDAVFAFAITLLVVSLEVPDNFAELLSTMKGFLAFGITFAAIIGIWYSHYIFFRRYGLDDRMTIVLNAVLLLLVLFYIYPLKFLTNVLIVVFLQEPSQITGITYAEMKLLMIIYSSGFLSIFSIFGLMYYNAFRQRELLSLTKTEVLQTQNSMISNFIMVMFGCSSIILALFSQTMFSGIIYWFVGPVMAFYGKFAAKKLKQRYQEENDFSTK